MKKHLLVIILLNLLVYKVGWTQDILNPLLINGVRIPPICLLHFVSNPLSQATFNLEKDRCMTYHQSIDSTSLKNNLLGYRIPHTAPIYGGMSIYYRYLGDIIKHQETQSLILVLWSGGGSGLFSNIISIKRSKDQLILDSLIEGGDRCEGGISEAEVKHGTLFYQQKVTPYMLLNFNSPKPILNGLPNCAQCCFGYLEYKNNQVIGFRFNQAINVSSKQNKMMLCLNRILKYNKVNRSTYINVVKLRALQSKIKKQCWKQ